MNSAEAWLHDRGGDEAAPETSRFRAFGFDGNQAAILRQLSAHCRHAATQSSMPSRPSQLAAQASHTSAQTWQVCLCKGVPINMKLAEARHISAQAIISLKCSGATCRSPSSRQWLMAIPRQVLWHARQASIHAFISADWCCMDPLFRRLVCRDLMPARMVSVLTRGKKSHDQNAARARVIRPAELTARPGGSHDRSALTFPLSDWFALRA